MDDEPQVLVGDCRHCLRRVEMRLRTKGCGVLVTNRNGKMAIEVRGASKDALSEMEALAKELEMEVRRNEKRRGQAGRKRKVVN